MNRNIKDIILTIMGTGLMALAINGFYVKAGITLGGVSGISLLVYNVFGLKTSYTVMILNILVLIMGYLIVGREFVTNTIIGSLSYPLWLNVIEKLNIPGLGIPFNIIIGSMLMGLGVGIVIISNSSSGGSDAVGIIINKKFGLSPVKVMTILDSLIMLLSLVYLNVYTIILSLTAMLIQMLVTKLIMISATTFNLNHSIS